MCGFAGEYVFAGGRADGEVVARMAARLAHRGPDEDGTYVSPDGRCAIGFRRLCVIDPPRSHQPMVAADGSRVVAFNGEIYNVRALRGDLAADGARFATDGDTEVLVHLAARAGDDDAAMLEPLRGMFALAVYAPGDGRLVLARDRLGQKPLWYARLPGRVVFASEAKALLAHPQVPRQRDAESLIYYLTMGYIPAPRTAWRGVAKLPPGSRLAIDAHGGGEVARWWSPRRVALPAGRGDRVALVRERVTQAVTARMAADVPLGALLSGGVDSSIVTAVMAQQAGRAGGVRTFTAGFDDGDFDERPAARAVAAHCRTEHTEVTIRPAPAAMLDELVRLYDEPFGDSSALPTWLICREARRHVTVALAGDGGDEVFGGYDRYRAMHLAERLGGAGYLAARMAGAVAGFVAPHDERSGLRRAARFARGLHQVPAQQYFMYRRLFGADDLRRLLTAEFLAGVDADAPADWFAELYADAPGDDEAGRAQWHDVMTYLPDDLLVKTDMASMAASLELRAPLLDHDVVAAGLSLPTSDKLDRRRGKCALRAAFAHLLPAQALTGPKRGFAVPLDAWLRGPLRDVLRETLLDAGLQREGIFRRDALVGLANEHLSGRGDHRHRLWALLVLARWLAGQR
ncbi:MAG: asparagine synthase (glutamine-hydrolyzing) [Phycisphaerae bacterium]|nr:asparagine synthase (glutamine-hydrolyzing) [Phycisphaerae bacterium]